MLARSSFLFLFLLVSVFLCLQPLALLAQERELIAPFGGKLTVPENTRQVLRIEKAGEVQRFKLAQLEALPLYQTELPPLWEGEEGLYQGVLLRDILSSAGIDGAEKLRLIALDGYVVELGQTRWTQHKVFVATRFQGREIAIEDKGPIRVLFPDLVHWDKLDETHTSEWIWNLKEIHVLP